MVAVLLGLLTLSVGSSTVLLAIALMSRKAEDEAGERAAETRAAVTFALTHNESTGLRFLRLWQAGKWQVMHRHYPTWAQFRRSTLRGDE